MNTPCKHGHVDGALHEPCYQCRSEAYADDIAELEKIVERANKRANAAEIVARTARKERDAERQRCADLCEARAELSRREEAAAGDTYSSFWNGSVLTAEGLKNEILNLDPRASDVQALDIFTADRNISGETPRPDGSLEQGQLRQSVQSEAHPSQDGHFLRTVTPLSKMSLKEGLESDAIERLVDKRVPAAPATAQEPVAISSTPTEAMIRAFRPESCQEQSGFCPSCDCWSKAVRAWEVMYHAAPLAVAEEGASEIPEEVIRQQGSLMHPATQVFFRAGLLACREYMAKFVEAQDARIAASIRANWWPSLGEDFGPPRRNDWAEYTEGEYGTEGFRVKSKDEVSPTQEALPIALQFLESIASPDMNNSDKEGA